MLKLKKVKCTKKRRNTIRLTLGHRKTIEKCILDHKSYREIGREIGFNHSVISREVRKSRINGIYNAYYANDLTISKRKSSGRKTIISKWQEIIDKLQACCSLYVSIDSMIGRLRNEGQHTPCTKTIYNWKKSLQISINSIRKYKDNRSKMHKTTNNYRGTPITERPSSINNREEYGHWEIDTFSGSKWKIYGTCLVLLERMTRKTIIIKLKNKLSSTVNKEIIKFANKMGPNNFKSITTDNGVEFSRLNDIKDKLKIEVYYCRTYRSCDKGSVENVISIIRRRFPKGINLSNISQKSFKKIEDCTNNIYRKSFNKSSNELFKICYYSK